MKAKKDPIQAAIDAMRFTAQALTHSPSPEAFLKMIGDCNMAAKGLEQMQKANFEATSKGGSAKTEAKASAVRANGAKGGRPRTVELLRKKTLRGKDLRVYTYGMMLNFEIDGEKVYGYQVPEPIIIASRREPGEDLIDPKTFFVQDLLQEQSPDLPKELTYVSGNSLVGVPWLLFTDQEAQAISEGWEKARYAQAARNRAVEFRQEVPE